MVYVSCNFDDNDNDMQSYWARLFDVNIGFHCPGWTLIMTSNRALTVRGGSSFAIIAAHVPRAHVPNLSKKYAKTGEIKQILNVKRASLLEGTGAPLHWWQQCAVCAG